MIRAIAFDWGGVFTEGTFDSSAVHDLAALFGVPEADVEEPYLHLMAAFERGAFDLDTFVARLLSEGRFRAPPARVAATFLGAVRWRQPMAALLAAVPPRYTVGVLSNNVPVLCDRVRDDARMGRVQHWVFSNEIGVRKPDPAAFEALAAALGVAPQETVFVDDNADNVAACEAMGFTGIHLPSVAAFAERWRAVLPDVALPPEWA